MIADKPQVQKVSINSKGMQAGRDAIDNSSQFNFYNDQEKINFGIIEDIFNFLFSVNHQISLESKELKNGKGLKKIPLNFTGNALQNINELVLKTTEKRQLVERFVNNQREIDESRVDALVIRLQKYYRDLKDTDSHYVMITDHKIIEKMAQSCIDKNNQNPDYYFNAIAIVLYFFEMCDFGKSVDVKPTQESLF